MVESKTSGTIRITFNSSEDKNNGFFELVQHSGSGFSGGGKNEYIITHEQGDVLRAKRINFTETIYCKHNHRSNAIRHIIAKIRYYMV